MTIWFRWWFLFSSFGPLYAIFASRLYFCGNEKLAVIAFATFLASGAAFEIIRRSLPSRNAFFQELTDVKPKDNEVFPYLMSYIPPLILRDLGDLPSLIPLLILYFVVFICFIRLETVYINPYFILFGYRIYEAKNPEKAVVTVIAKRRRVFSGEAVLLHAIGDGDLLYCE